MLACCLERRLSFYKTSGILLTMGGVLIVAGSEVGPCNVTWQEGTCPRYRLCLWGWVCSLVSVVVRGSWWVMVAAAAAVVVLVVVVLVGAFGLSSFAAVARLCTAAALGLGHVGIADGQQSQ